MKWFLIGIGVLAVAGLGFAAYHHYQGLVEDNRTLIANEAKLEAALKEQRRSTEVALGAIAEWKTALGQFEQAVEELREVQAEGAKEARRLNELFSTHDLDELARKRPGLIERRVDDGSDAARRMLECASGRSASCPPGR